MNRLIIVGSPRVDGRSAHLAEMLFETCIDECPDDEVALAPVSTLDIAPCRGCDACKALVTRQNDAVDGASSEDEFEAEGVLYCCAIQDDMGELDELIEAADELVVVSPVYFAGPPSQLKALLDRLQPYFWADARTRPKRPATLHVVGEGGDPHGFDPLVGIVRSALSCAGFSLERVVDWVGKIDEDGEITAEAVEYVPVPLGVAPDAAGSLLQTASFDECAAEDTSMVESPVAPSVFAAHRGGVAKPVLHVGKESRPPSQQSTDSSRNASKKQGGSKGQGQGARKKDGSSVSGTSRNNQSSSRDNQGSGRGVQGGSRGQGGNRGGQGGKRRG